MPKQFFAACRRSLDLSAGACRRRRSRTIRAADRDYEACYFFARRQAEELGIEATVVLEPMRRDFGPAFATFAVRVASRSDFILPNPCRVADPA